LPNTQARFQADYDYLVNVYLKLTPKPKIILTTPLPFPTGGNVTAATQAYMKDAIDPAVKAVATKYSLPLVDLYAVFTAGAASMLASDGGVNLTGTQKIAMLVAAAITTGSTGTGGTGGSTGAGGSAGTAGTGGGGTTGAAGMTGAAGTTGAAGSTDMGAAGTTGGGTGGTTGAAGSTDTGAAGTTGGGTGGTTGAAGSTSTGSTAGSTGTTPRASSGGCAISGGTAGGGTLVGVSLVLGLALASRRRRSRVR
jgi:hypothetical protein